MKNKNRHIRLLPLILLIFCHFSIHAQLLVSGKVVGENEEAIIGASVFEQNTNNGTITDINGNFSLNVKAGSTIVVSYIGYVTQTKTAAPSLGFILVEDTKALDEIVVVGYGIQKRSNVTGAISKVDKKDLENRTVLSAEQTLAGKTSGIQLVSTSGAPGSTSAIRIRGYSSRRCI
ncbi:MAG: carboxypeptidase-like regulatory domain-containing protein [Tannerellaceae bacterium]|nr:carboxypeptidase-like regulatory domain-containing protein [Tannerellaceae bacterium]